MPGTPGSGADIVGRIVAGGLSKVLGQQILIDNRPGAAGNLGAEIAARAAPDGHTLFHVNITHALNASLYRNLPYDLMRDFATITQTSTAPAILVLHPSIPAKSLADLVNLAKAKPGTLNYASAGSGTSTFLAAELFKSKASINLIHVPYKGGGEAQTSILSGETSVYFASIGTVLPHISSGRLRALAVTSAKRLQAYPEYPSISELGYPDYQSSNWYGIMAPARTPVAIISAIHLATVATLKDSAVAKNLNDLVYVQVGDSPLEFQRFIQSEIMLLATLVKTIGITPY